MGLIGGMARTAVIAGTATAVSNRVSRRQANRWNQKADAEAYQQQQQAAYAPQPTYAAPVYAAPAPAPAPAPAAGAALTEQLTDLANLHSQGILSDAEFAAAKAKLLGM